MIKNSYKSFRIEIILILFTLGVIFSFILTNKVLFGEKVQNIALSNSIREPLKIPFKAPNFYFF